MVRLIKAFHQVGGDDQTPAKRKSFLDQILDLGGIIPAIKRVQRQEMYNECFTVESQGAHSVRELLSDSSSPEVREALMVMAQEKINLLPVDGSTHTMFNCLDLIAGDFERVFLSVGDWYSVENGFVFDAVDLLSSGARYRSRDMLGYYARAVGKVACLTYDSADDARRELEDAIKTVREDYETTGKEAITLLRADCAGGRCPGEIVWHGTLPLGRAIEMWREGRKVKFEEGARR